MECTMESTSVLCFRQQKHTGGNPYEDQYKAYVPDDSDAAADLPAAEFNHFRQRGGTGPDDCTDPQ